MCFGSSRRSRRNENQEDAAVIDNNEATTDNSDYDKVRNDAYEFANSFGTLAKSMFDYSANSMRSWHDMADEWHEKNWDKLESEISRAQDEGRRKLDEFFPPPYELRDENNRFNSKSTTDIAKDTGFVPFRGFFQSAFGKEGEEFMGGFSRGKTPFGYFSFGNPSTRAYNDCLDKQGQSVWDSNGYWRCLFPQREVEVKYLNYKDRYLPGQILTKEDLEKAAADEGISLKDSSPIDLGDKGKFFTKFDDFLNWKNIMYENVKRDKQQRRNQWIAQREKYLNENKQQQQTVEKSNEPPVIVSSSTQSTYNSNSETNQVELNEVKTEYFSDGSTVTKNITKTKPFGAVSWDTVKEDIVKGDSKEERSSGWFWRD